MMPVPAKRRMTRRTLITAAAGAVAGGLVRPGGAIGALVARTGASAPVCFERWVGTLSTTGVTVQLGRNADLAGVQWNGPARTTPAGEPELRFLRDDRSWSRWVSAGGHGHGPDGSASTETLTGDPLWSGGATTVQLRAARTLSGVRLRLVDVSGGRGARSEALATAGPLAFPAALPLAMPVLAAGAGQPPIIARRAWAAGVSPPRVAPGYGDLEMAFVHHTDNPNGYTPGEVPAMLRAIYAFHRFVNGWNDIGYNFVLDLFGRIFEARAGGIDEPVVGAHAGGYNIYSTGVAVLGSFSEVPVSAASRQALERLLAWKLSLHGVTAIGRVSVRVNPAGARFSRFPAGARVSLPHIAGHRDADTTDCPGDVLYGELPSMRRTVRLLAGRPVKATLALNSAASPAPGVSEPSAGEPRAEPAPPTLTGALAFLDGTAIPGAPVVIQIRQVSERGEVVLEQTLAEVTTAVGGGWSLPIATTPATRAGTWLRALCPGAAGVPAAVSQPLHLPGGVALPATPAPVQAPTPPAAPPPAT
jgi:N-acetylmuramoyl-L-alanine amidase